MLAPKILVIDDDPSIGKLIDFTLSLKGYDVRVTQDPRIGMGMALSDPPHLILLDYLLPGQDGLKFLKDLRTFPDLQDTLVIMITGKGSRATVMEARQYRVADFIAKPFEINLLVDRVAQRVPLPDESDGQ